MKDKRLREKDRKPWVLEALLYASDKTINSFNQRDLESEEARDFFFRTYIMEYRGRVKF